jgi:glycosyltransferase involved in cell wall biosynthesis
MKVIHFGSVANVPYLFCYGLRELGITAFLVAGRSKMPFIYNEHYNPYQIDFLPLKGPRDYLHLLHVALQSDVLHFHCDTTIFKQLFLRMSPRVRLIRHFHGSDIRTVSTERRAILHATSNFLRETVLVSTFDLLKYWNGARHIPNPIDPIFFETASTEEDYSIFLPTRLENKTKNIEFAFKAWDILRVMDSEVVLKVIYWGEDADYYLSRYGCDQRIVWLRIMSHKKMALEMKRSSLIWGQFKLGQFGLTELEAMASEKAVLMRFNPYETIRYDPQYNPPLVTVKTPEELAKKTLELLSDKTTRIKLGKEARKWAERVHGTTNVARKLMEIYEELVDR